MATVLCLNDEPRTNAILAAFLEEMGHVARQVASVPAALAELETGAVGAIRG